MLKSYFTNVVLASFLPFTGEVLTGKCEGNEKVKRIIYWR